MPDLRPVSASILFVVLLSFAVMLLGACVPSADAAGGCDVVLEVDQRLDGVRCGFDDAAACCPEGYVPVGLHAGAVVCLGG